MAGLIKREDIDEVRSRVKIDDVIGQQVTLKSAGVGSKKGLCPFHDERTPSFHVRSEVGLYHCFGCGESGDVFSFLQKIDHLTFTDAVERLAGQVGVELHYEDGQGPRREPQGKRQRLLDAHQVAQAYFAEQLASPEAAVGRQFLSDRGFSRDAAAQFGVGYAPRGWDSLLRHLRGRGFTEPELAASGLVSEGSRGLYDRFRGRLVWPIRDVTGDTIGFGARRLYDDDKGPKYLNTPDTPLYRKNQVLYGIDLAKREIGKRKQIVVVEGYTDVMACHLAGVTTAVATCGTAFGAEHIKVARRMLSDDTAYRGEVIFTFDGDEAGRKAALRAFGEDQRFVAQTFVAVEHNGLDPCELRQAHGDAAVVELVKSRRPLFEFAIASTLAQVDLDTVEGRVAALRAAAPVVAGIRDNALRPGYARFLAGKIGIPVEDVLRAVHSASRRGGTEPSRAPVSEQGSSADPVLEVERQALQVALQYPLVVPPAQFDALTGEVFRSPGHHAVHDAIRAAGGIAQAHKDPANWAKNVLGAAPDVIAGLVSELAVRPLPMSENDTTRYCRAILLKLFQLDITRVSADLHGRLQRLDAVADADEAGEVLSQLQQLEERRRAFRSE
ncbi:DNA primase [Spelaeicoccus albus]|uniref:DNA primase n=1 Tax=Spelaeicoccus albus TaxID=1280376 RepID=A0A7Z0II78_9MICO|nr:DNA primase [Spelaeicoccus albus]NYI68209.1 DNA primase [Spelaeicoccus albus]